MCAHESHHLPDETPQEPREMYEEYWGLTESPFQNKVDHHWFFAGSTHEEALARLMYLVEYRRRFGLLVGNRGTGKSTLLDVLKQQVKQTQCELVEVDLLGLSADEMLWNVAAALNLAPQETESAQTLWRRVQDHLEGARSAQVQTVLLFDHLDQAEEKCLSVLSRLSHIDDRGSSWMTFVVATRSGEVEHHADVLTELSDLQIEVLPLDHHSTGLYIASLLERAGCTREVFDGLAIDAIYTKTTGLPRDINRLCDLSLLAAMGENRNFVDAGIVESAASELQTSTRSSSSRKSIHDRLPIPTS